MLLYINTKDKKHITVSLLKGEEVVDSLSDDNEHGSQVLLGLITAILDKNSMTYQDLEGISLERGPGSYTGIRVGAAVANTLGFSLSIPVNGKKIENDFIYE